MELSLQIDTGGGWKTLNKRDIAGTHDLVAATIKELTLLQTRWRQNVDEYRTAQFRIHRTK